MNYNPFCWILINLSKSFAKNSQQAKVEIVKNLNKLIDNKLNNKVHSISSGYTSFKSTFW